MTLFPLPVKAEMSDRFKMPARVLQFGDGYEQTGLAGLNRQQTTWDIEVIISSAAQDAELNNFLQVHGQHRSFTWQSPRDTSPQLFRITGDVSSTRRNGGGSKPVFFSRRMQFKTTTIESVITPVSYVLDLDFNPLIPVDRTDKVLTVYGSYTRSAAAYNSNFSGVFNGANTWLYLNASTDWNLSGSDVTIQCLINPSVMPTGTFFPNVGNLIHHGNPASSFGWGLILEKNHLNFSNNDTYIVRGLHGITSGNWYLLKYRKQTTANVTTHTLLVNDTQVGQSINNTGINYNSSRGLSIGCEEYGAGAFFNGFLNDVKVQLSV